MPSGASTRATLVVRHLSPCKVTGDSSGYACLVRTSVKEMQMQAVQALVAALRALGWKARSTPGGNVTATIQGRSVLFAVTAASTLDDARASALKVATGDDVQLVVADYVTASAREILNARGWSWLDRQGRLRIQAPGILVDVPTPNQERPRINELGSPLNAAGAREVAAELLVASPDEPAPGPRALARLTGLSPNGAMKALHSLKALGLVDDQGRPVVPDLFWALAEYWRPVRFPLLRTPKVGDAHLKALGAHLDDLTEAGWIVGDTRAALARGAPVVASKNVAPAFYVPSASVLAKVRSAYGSPDDGRRRSGAPTVAVAPAAAACRHRCRLLGEKWPVPHPVFVGLDLARDLARGREILSDWNPEGFERVW